MGRNLGRSPRGFVIPAARTFSSAIALAAMLALPATRIAAAPTGFLGDPGQLSTSDYDIVRNTDLDTITVKQPSVIINWTPDDNAGSGTIDFLPTGSTAIFRNDDSLQGGFTVLNRIVPSDTSRTVALNGNVLGRLYDSGGSLIGPGGNIWFYSPGGILVGSGASFDVGGLVLSTANLGLGSGIGTTADSAAGRTVRIDGDITATSYVGVIAPRIEQAGSVDAGGSVAYVAAERANITFNGDLFDISVPVGTTVTSALTHSGTTNVDVGSGEQRGIYLVAVPKNQALTMLLGGSIDFTLAGGAVATDQGIVLSARGEDTPGTNDVRIEGGSIAATSGAPTSIVSNQRTVVSGGTYGGAVDITANGQPVQIDDSEGATSFGGDVMIDTSFVGVDGGTATGGSVDIQSSGDLIDFGGNLTINATGTAIDADEGIGGNVNIFAFGGATAQINVDGTLTIFADGQGGSFVEDGIAGAGYGGFVAIEGSGLGKVTTNGLLISANGMGGSTADGVGGDGSGGWVKVTAEGGTVAVGGGSVSVTANATGGLAGSGDGGAALADGSTEGVIEFFVNGPGSLIEMGTSQTSVGTQLFAGAVGGGSGSNGVGGTATAGKISIKAEDGGVMDFHGTLGATVDASASKGANATGGEVEIASSGAASLTFRNAVNASLNGISGVYADDGGTGRGGNLSLTSDATIDFQSSFNGQSAGLGGASTTAAGGDGFGGNLIFGGGTGSISVAGLTLSASGIGGPGVSAGGDGQGGVAVVTSDGGTTITLTNSTNLSANATGGDAGSIADSTGGTGTGGKAGIEVKGGSITMGGGLISADGTGGSGNIGGVGQGGAGLLTGGGGVFLNATDGELYINTVALTMNARGYGGASQADSNGVVKAAGEGHGGYAQHLDRVLHQCAGPGRQWRDPRLSLFRYRLFGRRRRCGLWR
jgi:filamentous hemagglutinin family protein